MSVQLDRVIPLPQAAKKAGVSIKVLQSLVASGKLEAVKLPGGEIAVNEKDLVQAKPIERDESLRGVKITVAQAVEKYQVPRQSILTWVRREHIEILERDSYRMWLDESDVKYCVDISNQHKQAGSRARLFDETGQPYRVQHPELAEYRRNLRQRSRVLKR